MERCKTCRHWSIVDGETHGVCGLMRHQGGEAYTGKAWTTARYDEAAWLATAPDFGCTEHSPKEED